MKAVPYIDIHTHIRAQEEHALSIYNCIFGKAKAPQGLFSAGMHPWYIDETMWELQLSELYLLASDDNCIAIGECGLDKLKGAPQDIQEAVFKAQIDMAGQMEKPLIIHCVKKFPEVLRCLQEENFTRPFMLHGLNTNPENVKPFLLLPNAFYSFGAALLQPGSNAEKLFTSLPIEKCFLETDDRDIGIKNVYFRAAGLKGITTDELAEQILRNYKKVFVYGID